MRSPFSSWRIPRVTPRQSMADFSIPKRQNDTGLHVRDPGDTAPANGDQTKEKLVVKVVETKQWDEVLGERLHTGHHWE